MAKDKVTATSSTKHSYNSVMLGARTLKLSRDVSSDQKMTWWAKVMVKVTMTLRTASVSNTMYSMIHVSNIGPPWPSCFIFIGNFEEQQGKSANRFTFLNRNTTETPSFYSEILDLLLPFTPIFSKKK